MGIEHLGAPEADAESDLVCADPVIEALEQLIGAAVGVTTVAIARAAPADLRFQQWRALVVIGPHSGIRIGELAARIGMSKPSASRLIDRLEAHRYVSTTRDPRDGRATIVTLTDHGAEVRRAVMACRRTLLTEALGGDQGPLPTVGPELAKVVGALKRYA
ncbi:MAG: winged helix-turn-helix transcriptional regulator [Chloroflexi bacterium]|nr:winged helix-turn-helix transcriptional regulator [Chloroflexota bacterium]